MKFLKIFIIVVALVLLVKTFVFTSCLIPSSGMENTLYRGDRVIVNKWSYGFRTPLSTLFDYHRLGESRVGKGDIVVFNNPLPKETSVENKEVYISRCVGLPGDTLMLDNDLMLNEQTILSPDGKQLYYYPSEKEDTLLYAIKRLGISDNELVGYNDSGFVRSFSHYEIYLLKQELGGEVCLTPSRADIDNGVHPFVIPKKGKPVKVYPWNVKLLRNTIVCHEGKQAQVKGDTLLVEGRKIYSYIFKKDYYWMASNNSVNLCDSRLFGLVPEDHLIGKAVMVWFSKDNEADIWSGYRWNRFFQLVR